MIRLEPRIGAIQLHRMLSYKYHRGHRLEFLNKIDFQSLKVVSIIANSVDPDEMPHSVEFHQGSSLFAQVIIYEFPVYTTLKTSCLYIYICQMGAVMEVIC